MNKLRFIDFRLLLGSGQMGPTIVHLNYQLGASDRCIVLDWPLLQSLNVIFAGVYNAGKWYHHARIGQSLQRAMK